VQPELPPDLGMAQRCMVHWVDQGSIGGAALQYLIHKERYCMLQLPDPNHRVWNDVKAACSSAMLPLWRAARLQQPEEQRWAWHARGSARAGRVLWASRKTRREARLATCSVLHQCGDVRAASEPSGVCMSSCVRVRRTIVQLTLVFNLPYGPFGKGSWH